MKRKINFNALKLMNGQKVIVHDLTGEVYDRECVLRVHFIGNEINKIVKPTKKNPHPYLVAGIDAINEEFLFSYDATGHCMNGDFECYSIEE